MAFKNLEDRFQNKLKELYAHGSTRDDGPGGGPSNEPYLEWKPNDPNAEQTAKDSRSVPLGSIERDVSRLTKFTFSGRGLLFMATQAILQTGNTFAETRIYNPLFVIGNAADPYAHIRRPLTAQNDFAVKGDTDQMSPASADPQIFSAGRLQQQTSRDAIARVAGQTGGGVMSLLSLLGPSSIVNAITGVLSLTGGATLGVNERPELNVNGEYYSALLWQNYKKTYGVQSNFAAAMANLRVGNFKGAYNAIKNGITDLVNGIKTVAGGLEPRATDSNQFDGRRYFFEVDGTDHRYLPNTIQYKDSGYGYEMPDPQTAFLDRRPYTLPPAPTKDASTMALTSIATPTGFNSSFKSPFSMNVPVSLVSFNSTYFGSVKQQLTDVVNDISNNSPESSVESKMQFATLALTTRYINDDRIQDIRAQLTAQQTSQFAYWNSHKARLGLDTGNQAVIGQENNVDPRARRIPTYIDNLNSIDVLDAGGDGVGGATLSKINQQGTDLINVVFYDFVNKKAVPFRAFISNIVESINPEIHDTKYVGRIERNIIYGGVVREISFQLHVHAFSSQELQNVWTKVNYVTGLTFPASYNNGFMVPPFVKLTIGNIYLDQPGYIRSLTHTVEDDTSWEVEADSQVPHGILMNVGFSVIEKKQVRTGSPFYSITGN